MLYSHHFPSTVSLRIFELSILSILETSLMLANVLYLILLGLLQKYIGRRCVHLLEHQSITFLMDCPNTVQWSGNFSDPEGFHIYSILGLPYVKKVIVKSFNIKSHPGSFRSTRQLALIALRVFLKQTPFHYFLLQLI